MAKIMMIPPANLKPAEYSPLVLAYIGDCMYELYVRTYVVQANRPVHTLHKMTKAFVSAQGQKKVFEYIKEQLTQEEMAYFKRGRNAHSHSHPKNASLSDYRTATGFETMFGYLYLDGQTSRMDELFTQAILAIEGENSANNSLQE